MTTPTIVTMSKDAPAANREVAFLVGKHFSGEAFLDTLAWDVDETSTHRRLGHWDDDLHLVVDTEATGVVSDDNLHSLRELVGNYEAWQLENETGTDSDWLGSVNLGSVDEMPGVVAVTKGDMHSYAYEHVEDYLERTGLSLGNIVIF